MLNPNPYSSSITLPRFQPDLFFSSKWPTHSNAFIADVKIEYIPFFYNAVDENYSHIFFLVVNIERFISVWNFTSS